MEIVALIIFLPIALIFFLIILANKPKEQGTLQERRNNPELNTNQIALHTDRLIKFRKSKFKGVMFYQGPKGGRYYRSANGNKVYV